MARHARCWSEGRLEIGGRAEAGRAVQDDADLVEGSSDDVEIAVVVEVGDLNRRRDAAAHRDDDAARKSTGAVAEPDFEPDAVLGHHRVGAAVPIQVADGGHRVVGGVEKARRAGPERAVAVAEHGSQHVTRHRPVVADDGEIGIRIAVEIAGSDATRRSTRWCEATV